MSEAIDWFFDHVPEGIILEDDCVPHPDFFSYCTELLNRYRDDERVMHIGGDNSVGVSWSGTDAYRFMRWPQVWGWATWRRAWRKYDRDLSHWRATVEASGAEVILPDPVERRIWLPILERLATTGEPDTWDYQWVATNLLHGGLSTMPRVNLVSNVGFGAEASHTTQASHPRAAYATALLGPIHHPEAVAVDRMVDEAVKDRAQGAGRFRRRMNLLPWSISATSRLLRTFERLARSRW